MRRFGTALWLAGLVMVTGLLALPSQAPATHDALDGSVVAMAATPSGDGYWLLRDGGEVFAFGAAANLGGSIAEEEDPESSCCRGLVATPSGQGLWSATVGEPGIGGQLRTLGDAFNLGELGSDDADPTNACCRGLVATPTYEGLRGFSTSGIAREVGDAADLGNFPPDPGAYEAIAGTPSGQGLWGVTLGGTGVGGHLQALGDAVDFGDFVSEEEDPDGHCCRGLVATPTGEGLWAANLRGEVQTLGDAPHLGNFLNGDDEGDPEGTCCRGLVATPTGQGLWGFSANGRVRTLGDARFFGDLQGFARPKGATPLRVSLVPAYQQCASANRSHGEPLAHGSCSPPTPASGFLTVGSPDANGKGASSIGSLTLRAILGNPGTFADEADVAIAFSLTDVRSKIGLSDYTGELRASLTVRLTDHLNGASAREAATTADFAFPVTVPCAATPGSGTGATCAVNTTADALMLGAVPETKRSIWALGAIQVYDGGSDSDADTTGDNTLFATQGVFVP